MKKCFFILFVASFFIARLYAQQTVADSFAIKEQRLWGQKDSLELRLNTAKEDTAKVALLNEISFNYAFDQPAKGLLFAKQSLQLSEKLNYKKGLADTYVSVAWCQWALGDYNNALQIALKSLHLYEELKNRERIAWVYTTLANIYRDFGDYQKALQTAHQSIQLYNALHIFARVPIAVAGSIYEMENRLDSGFMYVQQAVQLDIKYNGGKWFYLDILMGNLYRKSGEYDKALMHYRKALPLAKVNQKDVIDLYNDLAKLYQETGKPDSSIYYSNEVQYKLSTSSYQKGILETYQILAKAYKDIHNKDSTIKYLELSAALNNQLFNQQKQRDIESISFNEQMRQEELESERQQYRNQLRMNTVLGIAFTLLVAALLLWRHNRNKQKAYALLQQQKKETEKAYEQLQSTQAQLIQAEKMASLGELTAGIAHEIQNPLNFVNNFSEVNTELIEELKTEIAKGNFEEVRIIVNDIEENEQKIIHHGKRADSIVKGMLQHSRQTKGIKEPININALCDEYLRLSYHGLRAKDKNFNAEFTTDFDETIGKINIVAQDIGRVLLNLFNNAFYAVRNPRPLKGSEYKPLVSVTTRKLNSPAGAGGNIKIVVTDNGSGIPQSVIDKIFQPFFTTKPTGEGTGLGLSLAYDIITKEHNGTITVESKEGEGSEFTIQLP